MQTSVVGHLRHVLLLYSYHSCYQLSNVEFHCYDKYRGRKSYKMSSSTTPRKKDFCYLYPFLSKTSGHMDVSFTVSFESSLYGSFDQCVVFDFGKTPYLVRRLNADVRSKHLSQTPIVSQHVTVSAVWDERCVDVVKFDHKTGAETLKAEHLSRKYSLPKKVNIAADELHRDNYKTVMHQLLFMEEGFMKNEISRYFQYELKPDLA